MGTEKIIIIRAVVFTPTGQVSRSDQVAQCLSNAIIAGLLEPEEQLPNEADLARMIGVSHITIREALNMLRANNPIHTIRDCNGEGFACENIDGKDSALHLFKTTSMGYLLDPGEMHCATISHSARLASRRMTDVDIAKFREFVEVPRRANSPGLTTQADMRCLLTIATSSHSARLVNQELQIQTEWASLVAILYRADSTHAETIAFYSVLADAPAAYNKAESVQFAMQITDTFTHYLIKKKLKCSSN